MPRLTIDNKIYGKIEFTKFDEAVKYLSRAMVHGKVWNEFVVPSNDFDVLFNYLECEGLSATLISTEEDIKPKQPLFGLKKMFVLHLEELTKQIKEDRVDLVDVESSDENDSLTVSFTVKKK